MRMSAHTDEGQRKKGGGRRKGRREVGRKIFTHLPHYHGSKVRAWLVGADKLSHNHLQNLNRRKEVCHQNWDYVHQTLHPFQWTMAKAGGGGAGVVGQS